MLRSFPNSEGFFSLIMYNIINNYYYYYFFYSYLLFLMYVKKTKKSLTFSKSTFPGVLRMELSPLAAGLTWELRTFRSSRRDSLLAKEHSKFLKLDGIATYRFTALSKVKHQ